jgi:hypothetical protein
METTVESKAKGKKNVTVEGVKLAKVDKDQILVTAEQLKIVSKGLEATVAEIARKLDQLPQESLSSCDNCDGPFPRDWDKCPFCGLSEEEAGDSDVVQSSALVASSPDSMIPHSGPGASMMTGGGLNGSHVVSAGEAQLDDAVKRINSAKATTAAAYYVLGKEILHVHANNLHKHRCDEKGRPAYKSFEDFRKSELKLPKGSVYGMMKLAKNFELQEIEKFGRSRLELILMAPEKKQAEFAAYVKSGGKEGNPVSRAKARAKLRELNAGRKKVGRPQATVKPGELTLAMVFGKQHKLAFFKPNKKGEEPVRAKKFEHGAWAFVDLKNGARIKFQLTEGTGGPSALVTFQAAE